MTDNTYSLASPVVTDVWDVQPDNHHPHWFRIYDAAGMAITESPSEAKKIAELIKSAPEMKATLDAIANSTEHADAAQKWECEKVELVNALRYLVGIVTSNQATIPRSILTQTAAFQNAERVIAKYEAPK